MNISEFWLKHAPNLFFGDVNFEALVRCHRPVITQTLTYEVEQSVLPLKPDQYFFGSVTITDEESKMTVKRLSREFMYD